MPIPDYECVVAAAHCRTRTQTRRKGAETDDVVHKDAAAQWCENATALTKKHWEYLKVPQKGFEMLQPSKLEHLKALKANLFEQ